ncbi:unnamed protein product [Cylindrotheca closterium]|uniref:Clu domain-containing protein n=1 Tax=Cylindrotheca closterium TaxID=2856 RepID=A0AAD2CAT5_9STRA|nr:unnamed protein product [Cylindrotheca closterium]
MPEAQPSEVEAPPAQEEKESEMQAQGPPILKNLCILPPRQKAGTLERKEVIDRVPLPPIRSEEPVSSIRAALADVCGYSHLTNYRFELEKPLDPNIPGKQPDVPIVSPYTGINSVVSVPVALQSLDDEQQSKDHSLVLDDYGDLSALMEMGLQDGSAFRIVLERYDVAQIRDHVTRLRSLIAGNVPAVVSLDDGSDDKGTPAEPENTEVAEEKANDGKKNKDGQPKDKKEEKMKLPTYPNVGSTIVNSKDLKNFYYHACGENPDLYLADVSKLTPQFENGSKKKKGKKGKGQAQNGNEKEAEEEVQVEREMREIIPKLNRLEETTKLDCSIRFSAFHPPPRSRKMLGDLAYLEVKPPGESNSIHITAIPTGFYVNKSTDTKFDPSPAPKAFFSHELLDCLLQASSSFFTAWKGALEASKTRSKLMARLNADGHFACLFRVAIRGDFDGYTRPSIASADEGIDALVHNPSWLVPMSKAALESEDSWNKNASHSANYEKTEDDLANTFGVDFRNGNSRDWNEELQMAREMPVSSLVERVERARVINKVLSDFGEASLMGIKAISDGQIAPMNPNEPSRSQVFLHNNIFFSRAIDAGIETFKIAKGDKAARKSASRDIHCLGALHRMEKEGLYTLATVLLDYLGTRFVCQSILPGILNGEKSHSLLYGSVEAGLPLSWDKEMHEMLEETMGKMWIANRPLPREPLTDERMAAIGEAKSASPMPITTSEEEKKEETADPIVNMCTPIEAKGIKGSDERKYLLDMTRLTPRDANWVEKEKGGTGNWEYLQSSSPGKKSGAIPTGLDDDEWTLAVLRPELVNSYSQYLIGNYAREKKAKGDAEKKEKEAAEGSEKDEKCGEESSAKEAEKDKNEGTKESPDAKDEKDLPSINDDDLDYIKSLRLNVNIFLPDIKSLEGIDDDAFGQQEKDEQVVRDVSNFLWEKVLPGITAQMRAATGQQPPHDGKSLTDFIHQNGVNCRYLGRLADMAQAEEKKDAEEAELAKKGMTSGMARNSMPECWLELLECEMVARAAKHVLDTYLTMNGGIAASHPAQTIASFLSALVSSGEESAAQTENRAAKQKENEPDEDDYSALTLFDAGAIDDGAMTIRGRTEIWTDIEEEIGRRFRYSLTIFNRPAKANRVMHIPLLRRVCQKTGVRLAAKSYDTGSNYYCGSGRNLVPSYPISPLDVVDIVPLMKHSAAHGGGFTPCAPGNPSSLPPLHISLPDARQTLESAHVHHSGKALSRALELAQEACALYQRVAESSTHPGVVRCLDLMASILFEAGENGLAAANQARSLGLLVQVNGFDCPDAINVHLLLFQMLFSGGRNYEAIKHMRAAIFLMELMGGPGHMEIVNAYHKLGSVYQSAKEPHLALRFFQEAASRKSSDRLLESMVSKSLGAVLSQLGDFKGALDEEKKANNVFTKLLGKDHQLTKQSDQQLQLFAAAAVQQGSKAVKDIKSMEEEAVADAIASELEAEAAAEEARQKKKSNGKKKKKGKK